MPQYKLTYFNARGRAEVARFLFAVAGVEYEDVRLEREEWLKLKPNTPFGLLPMLEVDGVMISESNTIARYLARKFGLAGKDEIEQAKAEMICDYLTDILTPIRHIGQEKDETKKEAMKKKYQEEDLPQHLEKFIKFLDSNGKGYLVGDSLTWADLQFICLINAPMYLGLPSPVDKYPKIKALKEKIESHEKVAAWIAKRPDTKM